MQAETERDTIFLSDLIALFWLLLLRKDIASYIDCYVNNQRDPGGFKSCFVLI